MEGLTYWKTRPITILPKMPKSSAIWKSFISIFQMQLIQTEKKTTFLLYFNF